MRSIFRGTLPIIIGQSLNAAGNERVARALAIRDHRPIAEIAKRQVSAGADFLDLCAAAAINEAESLAWLVETAQEFVDIPLSLDTASMAALRRAAPLCRNRPIFNSYSGTLAHREEFRAMCADYAPADVVVLCVDRDGVKPNPAERVEIASRLADELIAGGMDLENLIFDPIAMPAISSEFSQPATLQTIVALRQRYPQSRILCAVGNVGYGHAARRPLERAFALAARDAGADMFLCDLLDTVLLDRLGLH